MNRNKIVIFGVIILLIIFGFNLNPTNPNDLMILLFVLVPILIFYKIRNISAKWLWVISLLLAMSHGIIIENPAIVALRTALFLPALVFAIRRTFFVKR